MGSIIGITMGDPAGVGPEIIIKSLTERKPDNTECSLLVIGDGVYLQEIAEKFDIPARFDLFPEFDSVSFHPDSITVFDCSRLHRQGFQPGTVHAGAGDLAYRIIVEAVSLAIDKKIAAIVTAPICKESLHLARHYYDGHTGLIAKLTDTADYRMMFSARKLKIIHVTAHLPLAEACRTITVDMILNTIRLGHSHMNQLGIPDPKIAVCGLNPHAGENGIFGSEDLDIILPAVAQAKSEGISVWGPLPADTVFLQAYQGRYDLVVAQYHDQGHTPGKLVAFDTAVNVTVGLPIVRTSVGHGTAFDIAGRGVACHKSLDCAIDCAIRLVSR